MVDENWQAFGATGIDDEIGHVVLRSAHGSAWKGGPAVFPAGAHALNNTAGRLGPRVVIRQQKSYKRLSGLNVLVE